MTAALLVSGAGCVEQGPTEPTPPPPMVGAYTLTLEASAVCHLPVTRFVWEVEATSSGSATASQSILLRATLPAGDATVDLNLTASVKSLAAGTLTARSAAFGDKDLRVTLGGSTQGTITAGPAGRGQILDGTYNGAISLAPTGEADPRSAGSCTAADHRWTLVPR